ncbi:MAG: Npt1/Npt2 family nucleotide transporter [Caldilineaceae bacterium]
MPKLLTLTNLRSMIDVRAQEVPLVGLVLLYALCATTTDILISTTAYALFLDTFDAQRLPYIYVGVSLGSVLISSFYLQLSQRYSLAQLLFGKHLLLVLILVSYRALLSVSTARWLIFCLPIVHGVINVLLYMAFWNLVGRLFNLQQGKRLFGLFGAGQQIACLGVGILIPSLVLWLGAINLLLVAACASGGALLFLTLLTRKAANLHIVEHDEPVANGETATPNQSILRDSYIQLIFGMVFLFTLGSYFVDNIFYNRLEDYYPNEDQMASFLGLFNGLIGGLSLLSQFFVANRLLNQFGVRAVVILTPLLLLISTLLFALLGGLWGLIPLHFWLAVNMNLLLQVMNDTDNTAANLLYQPLPTTLRTRTQTIVDGIVSPGAVGITGVVLLVLTSLLHFDALQLSYVLLPILLLWAAAGRLLGRSYGVRVQQALRQRTIQGKQEIQLDRSGLEIVHQALANPHPGAVLYALDMLGANNRDELAQALPRLLNHASTDVRLEALTRMERLGENATLPAIYHCWQHDPEPVVRNAALQSLATLGGADTIDQLYDFLNAADSQVRRSVMIGFLRSGELEAILAAGEQLTRLISSPIPAERILAAQILGESGVAGFYRPLLAMVADAQPQVQRAALQSARKVHHPKLWPSLIAALAQPQTRAAARTALMAAGETILPTLHVLLAHPASSEATQPRFNDQVRSELVRICGRIVGAHLGSPLYRAKSITLLLTNLEFPDLHVRTRALQALSYAGYQADATIRPTLEAQIQGEFAFAAWAVAGLVDLDGIPAAELLRNALSESLRQQRMRFYWWFTLLYQGTSLSKVRDAFGLVQGSRRQPAAEQRAYLFEAIDLLLAKNFSKHLLPLLDELTPTQQLSRLATIFPQPTLSPQQRLAVIVCENAPWISAWLRAVALYTVPTVGLPEELAAVEQEAQSLTASPEELLSSTASWLLKRLPCQPDTENKTDPEENTNLTHCGETTMLLTIEKVIILRTVDIFAGTPDEVLVEVAALLKEIDAPPGTTIFAQGDQGDSMYIIVEGEVEARNGDHVFTHMGEREVFGEMALLDGEPRTATIRTTQATHLLRLDQEPFYELMEDRLEIVRGIIHVLLQRLRARTNDVNRLQAQLQVTQP